MRFVIFVRAVRAFEAETDPAASTDPALMAEMAACHEELARAGVLRCASASSSTRSRPAPGSSA